MNGVCSRCRCVRELGRFLCCAGCRAGVAAYLRRHRELMKEHCRCRDCAGRSDGRGYCEGCRVRRRLRVRAKREALHGPRGADPRGRPRVQTEAPSHDDH